MHVSLLCVFISQKYVLNTIYLLSITFWKVTIKLYHETNRLQR